MSSSTTVRISKKTKERLEKISDLGGFRSLAKSLDFAVGAAEDKLNNYRGNIDSLYKFKAGRSGFKKTSASVDKILAESLGGDE